MKIQKTNYGEGFSGKRKSPPSKRHDQLKIWMTIFMILILMVLLALSPICNIQAIEVQGAVLCQEREILEASGIQYGDNAFKKMLSNPEGIFDMRLLTAEESIIEKLAYIKQATVQYIFSQKVMISIIERTPSAVIPYLDNGLLIDEEGFVLEAKAFSEDEVPSKSWVQPVIKGIKSTQFVVGRRLQTDDERKLEKALEVIRAIYDCPSTNEEGKQENNAFLNRMTWIDVSDVAHVLVLVDSRVLVNFGEFKDALYKIMLLKSALDHIPQEAKGMLDFTVGAKPIFTPQG